MIKFATLSIFSLSIYMGLGFTVRNQWKLCTQNFCLRVLHNIWRIFTVLFRFMWHSNVLVYSPAASCNLSLNNPEIMLFLFQILLITSWESAGKALPSPLFRRSTMSFVMLLDGFSVIAAKVRPLLGFGPDMWDTHLISLESVGFSKEGNAR